MIHLLNKLGYTQTWSLNDDLIVIHNGYEPVYTAMNRIELMKAARTYAPQGGYFEFNVYTPFGVIKL